MDPATFDHIVLQSGTIRRQVEYCQGKKRAGYPGRVDYGVNIPIEEGMPSLNKRLDEILHNGLQNKNDADLLRLLEDTLCGINTK